LRQLVVAANNYEANHKRLPPAMLPTNRLGQHVYLLPYLEQQSLWEQIDSLHDNPLEQEQAAAVALPFFNCPSDPRNVDDDYPAKNSYRANAGTNVGVVDPILLTEMNDGLFVAGQEIEFRQVADGLSNTAMFSEMRLGDRNQEELDAASDWLGIAARETTTDRVFADCVDQIDSGSGTSTVQGSFSGYGWWLGQYSTTRYNHVMPPNSRSCMRIGRGGGRGGTTEVVVTHWIDYEGTATTASSWHPGGVNVALADGSVHFVSEEIGVSAWREMGSRTAGGGPPPPVR
jgi:prepilin-type processing-associated H-X9-DG protein